MGPEQLAVFSHSCKTQRTAPALAYNLKAGATKQRWMLWDLPALSYLIGMINGKMFLRTRYGPYRRQSA